MIAPKARSLHPFTTTKAKPKQRLKSRLNQSKYNTKKGFFFIMPAHSDKPLKLYIIYLIYSFKTFFAFIPMKILKYL